VSSGGAGQRRLVPVVGGITAVNLAVSALALITGPLLARGLGSSGRGDLAAILVPTALVPALADFGLSTYVLTQVSKGVAARIVLGAIAPVTLAVGLVVALLGPVFASLIAGDRDTVKLFLIIGFALTPVFLLLNLLNAVNWARERWVVWSLVRLIGPVGGAIALVALYVADAVTLTSAAVVVLGFSLLTNAPLLIHVRELTAPRWEPSRTREGLSFGIRAWLGSAIGLANVRVDQLVMTRAVSARELGLYAVAVNVTTLQQSLSAAVISVIFPRVSAGDAALAARASRVTLWSVLLLSAVLVPVVAVFLPLLFGSAFDDAVSMAQILLAASVPFAGTTLLEAAFTAHGQPGITARAQLLGLAATAPGLIFLLGPLGGDGAALASLAAYSLSYAYLLRQAVRHLGGGYRDYLVLQRADWGFLRRRLSRGPG
jgi:O-antigen/teichoic acid export membrane protein